MKYYQCTFSKGNSVTTGWIKENGAIVGALVELIGKEGLWEVTAVGHSMPASRFREHQRMNRNSFASIR